MIDYVDPSDITLELARRHVETFSKTDDLSEGHRQKMQFRDCEGFLEAGARAYTWLRNAELTLQEAARQGIEVPGDVVAAIKSLYLGWQQSRLHAEDRIRELQLNGIQLANLAEFHKACDKVRHRIQAFEMYDSIDNALEGHVFDEDFLRTAEQLIDH